MSFPITFLLVIMGNIVVQGMRIIEFLYSGLQFEMLWSALKAYLLLDAIIIIPGFYCFTKLREIKTKKKDIKFQKSIRNKIQLIALFSSVMYGLIPILATSVKSSNMYGVTYLFAYLIPLHICVWVVDGVMLKTIYIATFNTIYCLLSVYQKHLELRSPSIITIPVIMALVFFVGYDRYIKENFILKQRIKQQKNMYEKHLEAFQDTIIIVDQNKVLFANKICKESIADNLNKFYHYADFIVTAEGVTLKENVLKRFKENNLSEEIATKEKYFAHDLDSDIIKYNNIYSISLIDSLTFSGEKVLSVAIHDVSKDAKREQEHAEAKYKNMLFFSISHELRTPLNVFQAFLYGSKYAMVNKELRDLHKSAKGSWRYLRNKINDILDYVKILSGEFALHYTRFSLRKLAHRLRKVTISLLERKQSNIRLIFEVSENLHDIFESDQDRIEQVLFNFLSNAVRHTTSGIIALKIYQEDPSSNSAVFKVSDTGCGMTKERVAVLFEIQKDIHNIEAGKAQGLSGLGLTVSKMICNMMGSDLRVNSEVGIGSEFSFTILNHMPREQESGNLISESAAPDDLPYDTPSEKMKYADKRKYDYFSGKPMDFGKHFRSTSKIQTERKMHSKNNLSIFSPIPKLSLSGEPPNKIESIINMTRKIEHQSCNSKNNEILGSLDQLKEIEECKKIKKSISPENYTVLIVDDAELNRFVVKNMLQKYSIEPLEAEDGKDALVKLEYLMNMQREKNKEQTIIIFMDINMPIMDGIEATIEIRKQKNIQQPYIVALTAYSSENERIKCLKSGMNEFICKPLTKENLEDLFERLSKIKLS